MRGKWIGIAAVLVVVGAGATLSLRAERIGKPATEKKQKQRGKSSKNAATADLMAIVEETDSPEALTMALYALAALQPNDKAIIPLAIRHADRLGMLKGFHGANPTPAQEALGEVFEMLLGDELSAAKATGCRAQHVVEGSTLPGFAPPTCSVPASFTPPMSCPVVPSPAPAAFPVAPACPANIPPARTPHGPMNLATY